MDPLNGFNCVAIVVVIRQTGVLGAMGRKTLNGCNRMVIVCHWMHWCAAVNCCNGPTQWLQSTGDSVSLDTLVHMDDWLQWTH